ncbi:hypothetical protein TWF192_002657 [Orbilia oligospora]|uniref:CFEM domain-containing protein n=1 Tax=Orbilia oligospora TaxID=2813651 RepID=A0A6G1MDV7_ORBOL|nr:hypothetical protein TWF191_011098 [Orbilia oligospora]KAF3255299.1 hypothetical protein TWF192_002657 [Orbilia oligospora]
MHLPTPLLLLVVAALEVRAQVTTSLSQTTSSSLSGGPTPTTTGANRITYGHLPSCASECVSSAVQSVPCVPFVASCLCALPTGRISYRLPVECARENCGQNDIDAEEKWRETVCFGVTSTSSLGLASLVASTASVPAAGATATELCESGWKGCPKALNGGCCPNDKICNLLDCQPSPVAPSANITKISSPTEIPVVDITTVFPPCSHQCIAKYLPTTPCGLSPLNSTCFCELHDIFPCISTCGEEEIQKFVNTHLEICAPLWYFKPYDPNFERWCDLVDGAGKRGRPAGYDERMGNLEYKCPNWWEQRSAGKRFGIVLGIFILSLMFVYGCGGYWNYVGRKVTRIDKKKEAERRKIMGL